MELGVYLTLQLYRDAELHVFCTTTSNPLVTLPASLQTTVHVFILYDVARAASSSFFSPSFHIKGSRHNAQCEPNP